MIEQYLSALEKCDLFEKIEADALRSLIKCIRPHIQSFSRSDFVVRSGDKLESLGIVLEGEASVFKESISGNRLLIKNLTVGEMFGEIAAFARQTEWPALVQANTPLTVCFIDKNKITGQCRNLCPYHSAMITNMLNVVSKRALMLSRKMDYISIKTMRSKLCTFIYEQHLKSGKATFNLPMNRGQLADFLNVSRPSMSRELSRMKEEGMIDYHLSTIKILDIESLKACCE
ncbi:MAG TPA: transcriptional regulator [Ruminiclostridium sp.]|nr:transcriptional regulator [Ruminiclostridium sp.]